MIKIDWILLLLDKLWVFVWLSIIIGLVCFYLSYRYNKKSSKNGKWKLFFVLGCVFTLVVPLILYYLYKMFRTPIVTCYMVGPGFSALISPGLLKMRKNLLEKHLKENKISNSVYEKIKKYYGN